MNDSVEIITDRSINFEIAGPGVCRRALAYSQACLLTFVHQPPVVAARMIRLASLGAAFRSAARASLAPASRRAGALLRPASRRDSSGGTSADGGAEAAAAVVARGPLATYARRVAEGSFRHDPRQAAALRPVTRVVFCG